MPLTVKMRTGVQERVSLAHRLLPELRDWGVSLVTVGVGVPVALFVFCLPVLLPALHLRAPRPVPLHLTSSLLCPTSQLHGRSREQRYTRLADWPYIEQCAKVASPMPLFGRCPPLSWEDGRMLRPWEIPGPSLGPQGLPTSRPCSVSSGNGDILSFEDANSAMQTGVAGIMIAR